MIQPSNNIVFNSQGVTVVYTSKPFFKKYYFKIVYDFSTKPVTVSNAAYADMQTRISSRNIANNAATSIAVYLPNIDFKHRVECGRLSMFLESYGDFLLVSKVYPEKISSVTIPLNSKQIELMDEHGATTVFKHNLFHYAYRYKVSFYASDDILKIIPAIASINSQLTKDTFRPSENYNRLIKQQRLYPWNVVSIYYKDPQDIMMVRFQLGNMPHKIEKCVLYDEIS